MSCTSLSLASSHSAFRQLTHTSTAKQLRNTHHVTTWTRRHSTRVTAAPAVRAPPLIYILGSGNDARFYATSIDAGPAQGLCRLLMDSEHRFQDFFNAGAKIEVEENNGQTVATSFLGAELVKPFGKGKDHYRPPLNSMILPQYSPDPNLQHIPSPSFQEEKLFYDRGYRGSRDVGKPVRFHGDSQTLTYGEKPRVQIGGSTPVSQAELGHLKKTAEGGNADASVQSSKTDLKNLDGLGLELKSTTIGKLDEPIENLIIALPTDLIFDKIKEIRHRLSQNSTVLIPLRGGGLLDKFNNELFPDPASRPTYVPAIVIHPLWSTAHEMINITSTSEEIEEIVMNRADVDHSRFNFSVNHLPGRFMLSPAIKFKEESLAQHLWRKRRSEYLIKALKGSPMAGVNVIHPSELRTMQVRSLVVWSVVHSLSIEYGCTHGGILLNKERWKDVQDLCREAGQVFQSENPYAFSAKNFEEDVVRYIRGSLYSISRMFCIALRGRNTGTEFFNGFIARLGRERGVSCVRHERLASFIDEFAESKRAQLANAKELRFQEAEERRAAILEARREPNSISLKHSIPTRPGEYRLILDRHPAEKHLDRQEDARP